VTEKALALLMKPLTDHKKLKEELRSSRSAENRLSGKLERSRLNRETHIDECIESCGKWQGLQKKLIESRSKQTQSQEELRDTQTQLQYHREGHEGAQK
jgi:chromosome segregation ATPase